MPLNKHRACINCGDPVAADSDLCADCTPVAIGQTDSICPFCAALTPWEKVRRFRRTLETGRVEVLYYCPSCRSVLEAACWMER